MVKAQMALIREIQTDEYWEDISLVTLEMMRKKIRDLVKFTDKEQRDPVYTVLQDEIGQGEP